MPNKFNITVWVFFLLGKVYLFSRDQNRFYIGKNVIPTILMTRFRSYSIEFVWRQSGLAFFGAVASVAALFVFGKTKLKRRKT